MATGGTGVGHWLRTREARRRVQPVATDGDLLNAVPTGPDGRDWPATDPGLIARVTEQAVGSGPETLAALITEPGFLAAANPEVLSPLLWAAGPRVYDAVRAYRRIRPLLGDDANTNAAYLAEATQALTGAPLVAGAGIRPLYRTHLAAVRRDDALLTLQGHTALVGAVAFGTPEGGGEAGGGGRQLLASCGDDRTVRLWDPLTGMPAGEPLTGHSDEIYWVTSGTTPDGRLLFASCGKDRTIRLWDPVAGEPFGEPMAGHTGAVYMVAFGTGPDGRWLLASASEDMTLRLWDPLTCTAVGEPLTGHTGLVWAVTFATAPDGRPFLASAGWDNTIRIWDLLTRSQAGDAIEVPVSRSPAGRSQAGDPFEGLDLLVIASATGPDGRLLLATGHRNGIVRLYDPCSRAFVGGFLSVPATYVGAVAFGTAPDGQFLLAVTGRDRGVWLFDAVGGTPVGEPLETLAGPAYALDFATTPHQRLLLASSSGKDVIVWDALAAAHAARPTARHPACATSVAFTDVPGRGLILASASTDETVRLWNPLAGTPAGEVATGFTDPVGSVAFGYRPGWPPGAGRLQRQDGGRLGSADRDTRHRATGGSHRPGALGGVRHRPGRAPARLGR
ncbi:MAG TPA: WD40 repeat domain-containing protein [Streptosporangiaceae bacterium]|nr:WD40 repeat domain-containing protein [Streptosporangiaceae bacterium]